MSQTVERLTARGVGDGGTGCWFPLVVGGARALIFIDQGRAACLDAAVVTGSHLMGMGRRATAVGDGRRAAARFLEIGRASCRDRVSQLV